MLIPGALMDGLNPQDCFLRRSATPASRLFLGVRNPASGCLDVYLFLHFGLRPSPGWDGRRIKEKIRVQAIEPPSRRFVDFAGDLRQVESRGLRNSPFLSAARQMDMLRKLGARFRNEESKRRSPCQGLPSLGFSVDAPDV